MQPLPTREVQTEPLEANEPIQILSAPVEVNQQREETPAAPAPLSESVPRRSQRQRFVPSRYQPGTGGMEKAKAIAHKLACHVAASTWAKRDYALVHALLMDPEYGVMNNLMPHAISQIPQLLTGSKTDPDYPSLHEALAGPQHDEFINAMHKEITELEQHGTWKLVQRSSLPEGVKPLPGTWAMRIKRYPDGRFRKIKARFCVRGDKQVEGIDYFDKYAPVVPWSTVRLLLCMSVSLGWKTRQVDFSNAFVQANLTEDVYINLPPMFEGPNGKTSKELVMKLNRSLYGLVQAPLCWYNHLKAEMAKAGFERSKLDPCLFYGHGMVVLCYVDDCLFFGPNLKDIDQIITNLQNQGLALTVEDDDAYAFLGVDVKPSKDGGYIMTQEGLIAKILKAVGMEECNTKATPAGMTPLGSDENGEPFNETWEYPVVVGMLLYLSGNSRPEIQFAVHQCARFTHNPRKSHANAIKRICRYLAGTKHRGLEFRPTKHLELDCYCDADFAGLWRHEDEQDPACVKSRTGYLITLGNCPVTWVSKLQTEIALSTLEAEYIALSQSIRDLLPMRRLLQEIGETLKLEFVKPAMVHSTVFEDNNGALGLATTPKITPRTKHIAVKYHWFKSHIGETKGIVIKRIESENQRADIFTKGLSPELFERVRKFVIGW